MECAKGCDKCQEWAREVELLADALKARNERIAELERSVAYWSDEEAEQRALREVAEMKLKENK